MGAEGFDRGDRLRLAAGAAALFLLLGALTVVVWHANGPTSLDRTLGARARLNDLAPRRFFRQLTDLGSPPVIAVLGLGLTVLAWRARDRFGAALAVLGPGVAVFLTEVVAKPVIDRHKGSGVSFPSGHTTAAAAVAAVAVILVFRAWGRRRALVAAILASLLPLTVALGVVQLGVHYLTDAAGGIALGAGTVLATAAGLSAAWPNLVRASR
jgi:membrane-associated phospholipid phosphatase